MVSPFHGLVRLAGVVVGLIAIMAVFGHWSLGLADPHQFATVPALAVTTSGGKERGGLHYIVIQLDRDPTRRGPTIQFSERFMGSAVGDDWKEGVHVAVAAAAAVMGEDPRYWTLTIRNRSNVALTVGSSASSAVAVGIMAAWRGDALQPDVALTGAIRPDGRIGEVGGLPSKLEGAAAASMRTLLVPKGQARASESDLIQLGRERNITVVEVSTLREAYELMTGRKLSGP